MKVYCRQFYKIYCRHPFNTSQRVRVAQDCHTGHQGAKDLNFVMPDGKPMPLGTPVFAMESGTVAEVRRGLPPSPTSAGLPNNVVIKGSDGFYTEYAHITPGKRPNPFTPGSAMFWYYYNKPLTIGNFIKEGDLLGWVDNSGHTIGDPVIHIGRYDPGDARTLHDRPSPCNWYIHGVDAPYIDPFCDPGAYSGWAGPGGS
ncbi:M23 family metallopeptidase [Bacillus paralicheniformis]|uniref:M23 family metallopeptidase n=1 Tax=Bacillus paralicheniformis TaxID=1648923 RepID=UPI00128E81F4|nr:M23 family metallopeptidase [Bacillus paralicheniformis]MPQ26508.1 M23 family peptidase [Bacillus paralicheniformis]